MLESLAPEEQVLVELRFFQDLPFKEIADLMEMSEGAVKMRSVRLLQKLREKLG
jgi:RNA polymerase sigma-70 factor (ECF subfamily)